MFLRRALTLSMAAGLGLWLAGCDGTDSARRAPDLALACQTMDCVCAATSVGLFEKRRTAQVLWRANGDAYCPDGFVLEPAGN